MIIKTTEATIKKFELFNAGERVIVGVSGGPDSIALVYILNKLRKKLDINLHLAHLNHMIRKDEADQDSLFVQNVAKKLKLKLTKQKINVESFAKKNKLSLEDAARKLRYEFFLKTAQENQASKIALGHNWDDQAETVLMRFLRGSGISGLRAIPSKRKLNNCFVVRPLIKVSRKQIIHFLKSKDIAYRIDSSNLESLYFRNRIRNQLLPSLEKEFNPNIKALMVNLAENASDDFDYLQKQAEEKFKALRKISSEGKIALGTKKFLSLHKAMQKLIARSTIRTLKGNVRGIDYRHWKELEDLLENRPENSIVDLPGGVSVVKKTTKFVFYKRGE